jgi:hypothetical protein
MQSPTIHYQATEPFRRPEDFNPVTIEGWRWMACELMDDRLDEHEECIPRVTMKVDVWGFAMTVLEVCRSLILALHHKLIHIS